MATGKGVIQGYAAQATVDSVHQVIVAADVTGSGLEQAMLLPLVQASAGWRKADILITADAKKLPASLLALAGVAGTAQAQPKGQMLDPKTIGFTTPTLSKK